MDLFTRLNAALSRFLPYDKALHLIGGAVLFLAALLAGMPPAWAVAFVAAVAIGKELFDWDRRDRHTPDPWDAAYTAGAACIGYAVLVLLS